MMGEELNSSYVTERGLIGDGTYAVIDKQTGKVASAKNPRKWGKLFDFHSIFIDQPQDIVLRVTGPCTRCVMITLPQGDLPKDIGILGTVARYNQVHVGVHRGGTIHRGDPIRLEEG